MAWFGSNRCTCKVVRVGSSSSCEGPKAKTNALCMPTQKYAVVVGRKKSANSTARRAHCDVGIVVPSSSGQTNLALLGGRHAHCAVDGAPVRSDDPRFGGVGLPQISAWDRCREQN